MAEILCKNIVALLKQAGTVNNILKGGQLVHIVKPFAFLKIGKNMITVSMGYKFCDNIIRLIIFVCR